MSGVDPIGIAIGDAVLDSIHDAIIDHVVDSVRHPFGHADCDACAYPYVVPLAGAVAFTDPYPIADTAPDSAAERY